MATYYEFGVGYSKQLGRMGYNPNWDIILITVKGYVSFYEFIRAINHEELHSILHNLTSGETDFCFDSLCFPEGKTHHRKMGDSQVVAFGDEDLYELNGEQDLNKSLTITKLVKG